MTMNKILLVLIVSSGFLLIFYANNEIFTRKKWFGFFQTTGTTDDNQPLKSSVQPGDGNFTLQRMVQHSNQNTSDYNIFVIFTKENDILRTKLELFIMSLLKYSSIQIHLHIITDERSESATEEILKRQFAIHKQSVFYTFYDVDDCAMKIGDITQAMMPHFSSSSGSYYSDALFYLSLGLHRIVDRNIRRAILIDCDVVFRTDVKHLFDEFDKFSHENLFGLAPELTPVYYHVSYKYRAKNPKTNFGTPYYPASGSSSSQTTKLIHRKAHTIKHGYPGLNSGVVMLQLNQIRHSKLFAKCLKEDTVTQLTQKYFFKGHLGDQDYYTLLGYEFPHMFYRLDCAWNRQLCTWWKEHGYSEIFDWFFKCDSKIRLYHGNCNTRVPE